MKKMKTRIGLWISASMLALSLVLLLTNCSKDDDFTIPLVETNEVTEITLTTATSGGTISSDGGATVTERGVCWSENQNPTIADNKTTDGKKEGSFTSIITGLTANITYYVRAYATNSKGTGYGSAISFKTLGDESGTVNYNFKTVKIGDQVWMAENLNITMYNDGKPIPNVTDPKEWDQLRKGAYCNYDNLESNAEIYGRLYNWHAVNSGKLAPAGWHVPTPEDWDILDKYLKDNGYGCDYSYTHEEIAQSLCAKTLWASFDEHCTPGYEPETNNSSGFTALPGGLRNDNYSVFVNMGAYGGWWSSTERTSGAAIGRELQSHQSFLSDHGGPKEEGRSVRLIKD